MKAYINSVGVISPQPTFGGSFLAEGMTEYDQQVLHCIEPDYKTVIDPVKLRRMSRILKMGLGASGVCMQRSGVKPDAVVVGTGLACLNDLEKFFFSVKNENEQFLSPIPFINSSHNMISSQIAIANKLNGYNMTYIHNALSFENALLDALMQINEGSAQNVLLGGIDECTEQLHTMTENQNCWRKDRFLNTSLFDDDLPGTLFGEGSAFFMLGDKLTDGSLANVVSALAVVKRDIDIKVEVEALLERSNLSLGDIDTIVVGRNGDNRTDSLYEPLENLLPLANVVCYKHLCGEYLTSSAFAMWLSANMLHNGQIPQFAIRRRGLSSNVSRVLIYNQYAGVEHSFILIESV